MHITASFPCTYAQPTLRAVHCATLRCRNHVAKTTTNGHVHSAVSPVRSSTILFCYCLILCLLQEFLTRYKTYRRARLLLENRFQVLQTPAQAAAFNAFAAMSTTLPSAVPTPHDAPGVGVSDIGVARPDPITPINFEDVERCHACKSHRGICTAHGCQWAWIQAMVRRSVGGAKVVAFEHVRAPHLKRRYTQYRDQEVKPRAVDGEANEQYCFHGTAQRDPKELLLDFGDEGLDPRVGNGGFYGKGTYLAVDACYPIGGRYAHRVGANRVRLVVVKACTGTPCEMNGQSKSHKLKHRFPLFKMGCKQKPGSQQLGCWGQNTSRIQNKEV